MCEYNKKITIDEKFYGRLKSRGLTAKQEELFVSLENEVFIENFEDIKKIETSYKNKYLEIGFGSGEHIAVLAQNNPNDLFIGCEPFINGVASLLVKIDELNLKNIRIYQNDVKKLFPQFPQNYFSGSFLLFPDPWPKRRHIKRRFFQDRTLTIINNILKDDGYFRIATDHPEYQKWIKKILKNEKNLELFDIQRFDSSNRPSENVWPKTRYEQKSINNITFYCLLKKKSNFHKYEVY